MSNRIKELAKEAYISDAQKNNQNWKFNEFSDALLNDLEGFNQKFAELIIRECASIDFRKKLGISGDQDYEVSQLIKKNFGIDE